MQYISPSPGPAPEHIVGRLLHAARTDPTGRVVGWVALIVLAVLGTSTLVVQVDHLRAPQVYDRDFVQEYLLARAVLSRENPYALTAVELARRHLPKAVTLPHPIPHPPAVALMVTPLGLVSYETAAWVWFVLELAMLAVQVFLVLLLAGTEHPLRLGLVAFPALLLWTPVWEDLLHGQLSLLVAALVVGSWAAFRVGWERLAGALLGLSVSVKLLPAVIVAYFALERRWRVVGWAILTAVVTTAPAVWVIGAEGVRSFVQNGLPAAASWRGAEGNHAVVAPVWRLFAGSQAIAPVIDWPFAAGPVSSLMAVAVLLVAGRGVVAERDPDVRFSIAVCGMLLAGPLTWQHYFVVLPWPLAVLLKRLDDRDWPVTEGNMYLLSFLLVTLPVGVLMAPARALGVMAARGVNAPFPGWIGVGLLGFTAGPVLLLWLLLGISSRRTSSRAAGPASDPRSSESGESPVWQSHGNP